MGILFLYKFVNFVGKLETIQGEIHQKLFHFFLNPKYFYMCSMISLNHFFLHFHHSQISLRV